MTERSNILLCTVDGCTENATYTFVWPWGTPGACCQKHTSIVTQRSQQTRGRFGAVAFAKLNPDRPPEITRNERITLHSARLAAESERDDASRRATELYAVNTKLADEVRALRARCAQLEADAKALREQVELAYKARDQAFLAAEKAREEASQFGVTLTGSNGAFETEPPPALPPGYP